MFKSLTSVRHVFLLASVVFLIIKQCTVECSVHQEATLYTV